MKRSAYVRSALVVGPASLAAVFTRHGAWSLVALATMAAGVATIGGCPQDPLVLDTQVLAEPPTAPGLYWIEPSDSKLVFYRLPEDRNDPGTWTALTIDLPEWYTEPGVYDEANDGTWTRTTLGDGLTLDDVLQLYDPAPQVP